MAGTVVTTEITYTPVKKVSFAYTKSSGGAADATTTASFTGMIERVVFDWTDATASYDVLINDSDGFDVLIGNGANLAAADVQKSYGDGLAAIVNSTLTLALTAGGDTKTGTVHVYIR